MCFLFVFTFAFKNIKFDFVLLKFCFVFYFLLFFCWVLHNSVQLPKSVVLKNCSSSFRVLSYSLDRWVEEGGLWNTSTTMNLSHRDEVPQPDTTCSFLVGNLRRVYSSGSGFVGILQPCPGHRSALALRFACRKVRSKRTKGVSGSFVAVSPFLCVNLYQSQSWFFRFQRPFHAACSCRSIPPDLASRSQLFLLPLRWDPTLAQPEGVGWTSRPSPSMTFSARERCCWYFWLGLGSVSSFPLVLSLCAGFSGIFAISASGPTCPARPLRSTVGCKTVPVTKQPTNSHPPKCPFQLSLPDVSTSFLSFIYHFNKYFFSVFRSIWGISPRCSTGTHHLLTSALSWSTGAALQ